MFQETAENVTYRCFVMENNNNITEDDYREHRKNKKKKRDKKDKEKKSFPHNLKIRFLLSSVIISEVNYIK